MNKQASSAWKWHKKQNMKQQAVHENRCENEGAVQHETSKLCMKFAMQTEQRTEQAVMLSQS